MKKLTLLFGLLLLTRLCSAAPASTISVSNSFTSNTTILSSEANENFRDVTTGFNSHTHEDITKLGTISTGIWQATAIDELYGGTGFSTYTTGDLIYSSAANTLSKLGIGSASQHLIVSGGIPAWSNAIVATSGTINGTTIGATTPSTAIFSTLQAGTGGTPALYIGTAGNVGIGTTNPTSSLQATGNINIGGTGTFGMLAISSTSKVTNLNADLLDGSSASTTTGSAVIPIADASGYLPNDSVDTTALKTAVSQQSYDTTGTDNGAIIAKNLQDETYATTIHLCRADLTSGADVAVTGGAYCFYPQVGDSGTSSISQFTYVTASGTDMWIYLLIDKGTKDILSVSVGEDHPAYGNGGNFENLPHPFKSFYEPIKHEIILLDKETAEKLKNAKENNGEDILLSILQNYKPSNSIETYQPLHSGKWLIKKDTGEIVKSIPIGDDWKNYSQIKEIMETIPDYIKVRRLIKLSPAEKAEKEAKQEQARVKAEAEKAKKEQDKISAENKLKVLGLTKDEIEAIIK